MISIFRDKSIVAVFALVLCTCLIHCHAFFTPITVQTNVNSGFINYVLTKYVSKFNNLLVVIIYLLLIFMQGLRLNAILNNNKMYASTGFTIAFAYILFTGLLPNSFGLSAALIANSLIMLLYLVLLKLYNNNNARGLIFNAGFVAGFAVIAYYPLVIVAAISIFGLAILRPFKIAEWFILLLGLVAPFYLLFSILYLSNYNFHLIILPKIALWLHIEKEGWTIFNLIVVGLFLLAAFISWYPNSNKLVIQIRKNWIVMLILLLLCVGTIFLFTKSKFYPELICLVPAAAFVANFFIYPKKTYLINIFIAIAIIAIIYNNSCIM